VTARRPAVRLLVFLHGTTIMHPGAAGRERAERVAQSKVGSGHGLEDFGAYVVIGQAADKLRAWAAQGAQISYLTSHREQNDIEMDAEVLHRHGFPPGPILARRPGENYGQVVEREMPDVLVEDDCESIGAEEIAYAQVGAAKRAHIRSIIVPEFGGIDHLPDSLAELAHG
jgi:hypothetical protein